MKTCPVCGFDPEVPKSTVTMAELRAQKLQNHFNINKRNSWWLKQPEWVCEQLKEKGVHPKKLIDVGCGDGRWVPGLVKTFPEIQYAGVDNMEEQIRNCYEVLPDFPWYIGDFALGFTHGAEKLDYDTVLFGGLFNPKMMEFKQRDILEKTKDIAPEWVVCLFDLNQTGERPDKWLLDKYDSHDEFYVPDDLQGPMQKDVVWTYRRK